jgi:ribonuclease P protein component
MIGRAHRFHGYGSLRYVYRHGQTVRGPLFAIKAVANPRRRSYRFAVVVSRKVNKSAVVRNRIRRRAYEAIRLLEKQIEQPHDIVMTVFNDDLAAEPFEKLLSQLLKQFNEIGIVKKTGSAK